jgi:hypothetical protein
MQTNFSVTSGSTAHELPILPVELQNLIWNFMCSTTRFVNLRYVPFVDLHAKDEPEGWRYHYRCIQSDYPAPIVLQICKASRYEGLKHYKRCFNDSVKSYPVYLNPRYDIVAARGTKHAQYTIYQALACHGFQNIAIGFGYSGYIFYGRNQAEQLFKSLKQVIVLGESDSEATSVPGVDIEALLANKSVISKEPLNYNNLKLCEIHWFDRLNYEYQPPRRFLDVEGEIISYEGGARVVQLEFKQRT